MGEIPHDTMKSAAKVPPAGPAIGIRAPWEMWGLGTQKMPLMVNIPPIKNYIFMVMNY